MESLIAFSRFTVWEGIDLIYEGITTALASSNALFSSALREGIDLIYEGITTPGEPPVSRSLRKEGIDLIYEGITTRASNHSRCAADNFPEGIDLIYEGITTVEFFDDMLNRVAKELT